MTKMLKITNFLERFRKSHLIIQSYARRNKNKWCKRNRYIWRRLSRRL